MRLIMALINVYVSLWKAWTLPEPSPTLLRAEEMRRRRAIQGVVYDQERENDTYHDSDWEWPVVPPQENRVPSTALMRMFNPDFEWAEYAKSVEYAQFVYEAEEGR